MKSPHSSPGHYNCWLNTAFIAEFRPTGLIFLTSEIKLKGFSRIEWPLIMQRLRVKAMGSLEIKYIYIKKNNTKLQKPGCLVLWGWSHIGNFFNNDSSWGQVYASSWDKQLCGAFWWCVQDRWEEKWFLGHVPTPQIPLFLQTSRPWGIQKPVTSANAKLPWRAHSINSWGACNQFLSSLKGEMNQNPCLLLLQHFCPYSPCLQPASRQEGGAKLL